MTRMALFAAARLGARTRREQQDANRTETHYPRLWVLVNGVPRQLERSNT
jgi:hypothetical protein